MSKYKIGDRVKILDGSNIRDYIADWYDEEMKRYVGTTGVIKDLVAPINAGSVGYHLEGNPYVWDERGLELVVSPSLYALADNLIAIAQSVEVDPDTGETTGIEALEEAQGDFEEKAAAVAIVIREKEAHAAGLDDYISDLQKRKKSDVKAVDRLKQYLIDQMECVGIRKIDRVEAKITLRNSESVEVVDESLIPEKYKRVKYEISKSDIKTAIKDGISVDGARIITKTGVIIK